MKIRLFRALIESVFLYNSEIWGLTSTQESEIDVFQRQILRNILSIRYSAGNWCSNEELYNRTKQNSWSQIIKQRRWRFLGTYVDFLSLHQQNELCLKQIDLRRDQKANQKLEKQHTCLQ